MEKPPILSDEQQDNCTPTDKQLENYLAKPDDEIAARIRTSAPAIRMRNQIAEWECDKCYSRYASEPRKCMLGHKLGKCPGYYDYADQILALFKQEIERLGVMSGEASTREIFNQYGFCTNCGAGLSIENTWRLREGIALAQLQDIKDKVRMME